MNKETKVYLVWGMKKDGTVAIPDDIFCDFSMAQQAKETIWKVLGDRYKWIDIKEMHVAL